MRSFTFPGALIFVSPPLDIVAESIGVMVIQEYDILLVVAVPPFALRLVIEVRVFGVDAMRLTDPRFTVVPDSSDGFSFLGILESEFVASNVALELFKILYFDISFIYRFRSAFGDKVTISASDISLDISSSGANSILEGSFKSRFFLVAVCICSIIFINKLEVGGLALFLEEGLTCRLRELDEVLNVRSAFGAFL